MNKFKINIIIIFTAITFVSSYDNLYSSESKTDELYITPEFGYGNYWNLGINLTYTYEQNVSFQFGTSMMWKKASSIPIDYKPNIIRLSFFSPNPLDHLDNIHFSIGKIFYLNKLESMRLNLSIGAAVTTICEPRDWERNQGNILGLEDTYDYNHYEYKTISLIITPSIEFPVDNDFGINITPMY